MLPYDGFPCGARPVPLRILLVRHGLSSFNLEQRFPGRDDLSSLLEEGARQARAAGEALADLPLTAVYSSPLSRARDTTALLLQSQAQPPAPRFDDDLLEIDLGPWSGLLRSEVRQRHPEQERIWRQAPETMELKRADGSPYRPLPELMVQAQRFLDQLLERHAYTSPMARPRQTAERILLDHPDVPLTSNTGLVEIGHGLWEGQLEKQIAEGWPELLGNWKSQPHTVQMPEGETLQQVWDRSLTTWNRIALSLDPGETALVVAHDAVNKTILCGLLGLGPEAIWAVKQGNGGVTVVDYPQGADGLPVLTCMNLTAHLGGVLDRTAAGAL